MDCPQNIELKEMDRLIRDVKEKVEKLIELSADCMPCVESNCQRIMASLKILELNVSDVLEFID